MGKYLRSSCKQQQQQPSSPAAVASVAAAAVSSYLTLRSGRRVPPAAAAGGSPCRRRHRRGGLRCAAKNNSENARKCAASAVSGSRQQWRCKAVGCSHSGELDEVSPPSSTQGNSVVVVVSGDNCGERRQKPVSGEVVEHHGEHNRVVAGRRPSLSPPEAEIEAFFAAAELTERRRFAETYNYDIALDRPLQGRYEWAPVST